MPPAGCDRLRVLRRETRAGRVRAMSQNLPAPGREARRSDAFEIQGGPHFFQKVRALAQEGAIVRSRLEVPFPLPATLRARTDPNKRGGSLYRGRVLPLWQCAFLAQSCLAGQLD